MNIPLSHVQPAYPYTIVATPIPAAQVKEWEKMGQPDPIGDHMQHFVAVLKTSHAAAMADAEAQGWFAEPLMVTHATMGSTFHQ